MLIGTTTMNEQEALNTLADVYDDTTNFMLKLISLTKLQMLVSKLKPDKNDKFGDTPSPNFKNYFHFIAPGLLQLVNKCLTEGIFLESLKIGKIR